MYETSAARRLLSALRTAFGDEARWELTPNRSYGYYLRYDEGHAEMAEIRDLIDSTLRHEVGVILSPRYPEAPPIVGI
jgi:hypothetical protein